jgi:hypothetical protein
MSDGVIDFDPPMNEVSGDFAVAIGGRCKAMGDFSVALEKRSPRRKARSPWASTCASRLTVASSWTGLR